MKHKHSYAEDRALLTFDYCLGHGPSLCARDQGVCVVLLIKGVFARACIFLRRYMFLSSEAKAPVIPKAVYIQGKRYIFLNMTL